MRIDLTKDELQWLTGLVQAAWGREMDNRDIEGVGPDRNELARVVAIKLRRALQSAESPATVRRGRPRNKRKGEICPACVRLSAWRGYKKVVGFIGCGDCNGTGRLRPC
jgi:hypothetical protein